MYITPHETRLADRRRRCVTQQSAFGHPPCRENRIAREVTVVSTSPVHVLSDFQSTIPTKATVARVGDVTFYAVELMFTSPAARPAYLDVHVFDQDAVAGKQVLSLADRDAAPQVGWQRLVWPQVK